MRKIFIITYILSFILILSLFGLYFVSNLHPSYNEEVIFLSESIGCVYSSGLCINVTREYNKEPHLIPIKYNSTFYFDGEFKLKNYSYGDYLNIHWEYIPQIKDYRVRGVNKK